MNDVKIPKWFWVVSVVALVWNAMGVMAFLQTMMMSADALAQMGDVERQLHLETPTWVNVAFAFAVIGGFLGCVLLLLKKKLSLIVLVLSLLGVLTQMYYSFFMINSYEVFGPGGLIMPIMVIIISILLVLLAKLAIGKNWLK